MLKSAKWKELFIHKAFSIVSINVRGIGDHVKRKCVFDHFRRIADILCIQETHSSKKTEQLWTNEWGGRILFSHGTTNARGVAILFKKGFFCNIGNITNDFDGRVICCEISWPHGKTITVCNIYAPNHDSPAYFDGLAQRMCDYVENVIILGDFNLVLCNRLDRRGTTSNNERARNMVLQLIEQYNLAEVWRERNPNKIRMSWSNNSVRTPRSSRIDYCLVSRGLDQFISEHHVC